VPFYQNRALEYAETMARLRPNDWLYTYKLGTRYQRLGRSADARDCFESILRMTSGRAWGHYGLALLLTQAGDARAAKKHLREALREDPDLDEARKLLERYRTRRQPGPA
jgi:tetratricopeptide (TPR) repeat protein